MTIKIQPVWTNWETRSKEEPAFRQVIEDIGKLGYTTLLLHYSDGSVLMRQMTEEEKQSLRNSENDD